MDLLHNPLADLPGEVFLAVYAIIVVATILIVAFLAKSRGWGPLTPLRIPAEPDPLEIAVLRGGAAEAARTAIVDLHARGLIELEQVDGATRFRQTKIDDARERLAACADLERALYRSEEHTSELQSL